MGVIQNAINQMLGTAGIAARLSPELERKAQIRAIKKEEKDLSKITTQLSEEVPDISKRIQAEADLGLHEKRIEQAKKEQALGIRTPGNAAEIIRNEKKGMQIAKLIEDKKIVVKPITTEEFLKMKQNEALKKADTIKDARDLQKTRVKNYPEDLKKTINLLKGRDMTDGTK